MPATGPDGCTEVHQLPDGTYCGPPREQACACPLSYPKTYSDEFYVARSRHTGSYAREGHETGMGKTIESTPSIAQAMHCHSPAGIMAWMGGHYKGYDAIRVTEQRTYVVDEKPTAWPDPKEVWDE